MSGPPLSGPHAANRVGSTPGPVFLEDETVSLRPAEETDIGFLRENEQDPHVRTSRSVHLPVDTETAREREVETVSKHVVIAGTLKQRLTDWAKAVTYGI